MCVIINRMWRRVFTDPAAPLDGFSVGESFLWPVKNYGVMKTEKSGWFLITDSKSGYRSIVIKLR